MNYYFITGTSRGLGKALAQKALTEKNTKVIGISRKSTIISANYSHHSIDLSEVNQLENQLAKVFTSLVNPEKIVLINNSGILGDVKYMGENTAQNIIEVQNINTIAPAIIMNSFIQKYAKTNCEKKIINISSGAGKNAVDGWSNYCASKAALDMYSRVVAEEQKKRQSNFKVYAIAPGVVDTFMQDHIRTVKKEDFTNLQKFIDYKNNDALSSPNKAAEQYWWFLNHEDEFDEVLLDVRNF